MAEHCPLTAMQFDGDIPEVCREQCGPLWETAMQTQVPDRDDFESYSEVDCTHPASEFSNESLQPDLQDRQVRHYAITDQCEHCEQELGSDSYRFTCPNA
jgi:hypothetical protein